MKWRSILTLTLGLVLAVAAGGAVLTILQQVNRPRVPVAIAAVDLAAGQPLRSDSVRYELVDSRSLALKTLLTESQVQELIGLPLAHAVARSEFLSASDIAAADSPAAAGRVALMLSDPSLVAVAIPIGEDTAPGAIVVGDSIDISVGLNGTNYARPMDPENSTGNGLYASEVQAPDTFQELQATQVAPEGLLLPAAKVALVRCVQIPPQLKQAMLRVGSRKHQLQALRETLVKDAADHLRTITATTGLRSRVLKGDPARVLVQISAGKKVRYSSGGLPDRG